MNEPTIDSCITALIERISSTEMPSTVDKMAFVSLYYLFKEQFLLALDLLDHQRIMVCTWNTILSDSITTSNEYRIYYIILGSEESHGTSCHQYEVRTTAWYCSCPEFAFSAFNNAYHFERKKTISIYGGYWGGYILGQPVPICKHLLACILVEHGGPWARQRVIEKQISKEELISHAIQ